MGRHLQSVGGTVEAAPRALVERSTRRRPDRSRFVVELSAVFRSADGSTCLEALVETAVQRFADLCVVDIFESDSTARRLVEVPGDANVTNVLRQMECQNRGAPPLLVANSAATSQHELGTSPAEGRLLRQCGVTSLIRVPMLARGRRVGIITFALRDPSDGYTEEDLANARAAATLAALSLQLSWAESSAESALRERDETVSMLAHEVRTPLTLAELLAEKMVSRSDGPPELDAPETLVRMRRTLKQLEGVIDGILDASRFRNSGIQLRRHPCDLSEIALDVVEALEHIHGERGCVIRVVAPERVIGNWDPTRLEQLVTNLVSNALKFGANQPVDVTVEALGSSARLTVTDRGIGISPEAQKRLFQPFSRAAGRDYRGLGLGLFVCRQIVEAHGGFIIVHSEGKGSTFTVELPVY